MRDLIARVVGRRASSTDAHVRHLADIGRLLRVASGEPKLDDTDSMDLLALVRFVTSDAPRVSGPLG